MKKSFMIEFELPEAPGESFISLIPRQRNFINQLLSRNIAHSYSLSADRSKLWMVMYAKDEWEVQQVVAMMPLYEYMSATIHELMFHNKAEQALHFSLN